MMRILLADANAEVRAALRLVIEQQGEFRIAAEAQDAISLMTQIATGCMDVVLLDSDLPGLQLPRRTSNSSLSDLIHMLRMICPAITIIALSSQPTEEKACLLAKADAFICKSDPPDALLALIERLLAPDQRESQ
jgi:two-component system, NarL family, invasion response regulator UvrY